MLFIDYIQLIPLMSKIMSNTPIIRTRSITSCDKKAKELSGKNLSVQDELNVEIVGVLDSIGAPKEPTI